MTTVLIVLASIFCVIAISVLIIFYKITKFKNKLEDTVIDGVKQVIVEHGPEAVKYVKNKVIKNK